MEDFKSSSNFVRKLKNYQFRNIWLKNLNRQQVLSGILAVFLCIFIFSKINQGAQKPFPLIADGNYFGKIVGLNDDQSQSELFFNLIKIPEQVLPSIRIFSLDSQKSEIEVVNWVEGSPLLIKSENFFLRFSAESDCETKPNIKYCGAITNLKTGNKGSWYLTMPEISPVQQSEKTMLIERATFLNRAAKSEVLKAMLVEIKNEAIKLSAALQDAESIKSKSDSRFSSQQQRISDLQTEIDQEELTLKQLQSNFDVAKSVSPKGRVTILARQILAKEFDILTPSGDDSGKLELIEKAKNAREVLALKKQVEILE